MSEAALEDAPVAGDVVDANVDPEASTDPVETPAPAPAYDPYDDPRILELVQEQAAQVADRQLRSLLAEAQTQAQQPAPQTTTDFFDEDGNFLPAAFAEFQTKRDELLASQFREALSAVTAPLQERQMQETVAEGEQRIKDMIADDEARNGEFPKDPETGKSSASELIRPLADAFFPQIAGTYGNTARAAELAVSKAASIVRSLVKEAQTAGVTEHVNRNAKLAGLSTEPGVTTPGVVTFPGGPQAPGSIAERYGRNANAIRNGT